MVRLLLIAILHPEYLLFRLALKVQRRRASLALSLSAPSIPALFSLIVISILSLNFLGDGLRDAADPYEAH